MRAKTIWGRPSCANAVSMCVRASAIRIVCVGVWRQGAEKAVIISSVGDEREENTIIEKFSWINEVNGYDLIPHNGAKNSHQWISFLKPWRIRCRHRDAAADDDEFDGNTSRSVQKWILEWELKNEKDFLSINKIPSLSSQLSLHSRRFIYIFPAVFHLNSHVISDSQFSYILSKIPLAYFTVVMENFRTHCTRSSGERKITIWRRSANKTTKKSLDSSLLSH